MMNIVLYDAGKPKADQLLEMIKTAGRYNIFRANNLKELNIIYRNTPVDVLMVSAILWDRDLLTFHRKIKIFPAVAFFCEKYFRGFHGLGLNVPYYLPVDFTQRSVNKVLQDITQYPVRRKEIWDRLIIRKNFIFHYIPYEDILAITARGTYTTIHLRDAKPILIYISLIKIMGLLPPGAFYRSSRNSIHPESHGLVVH